MRSIKGKHMNKSLWCHCRGKMPMSIKHLWICLHIIVDAYHIVMIYLHLLNFKVLQDRRSLFNHSTSFTILGQISWWAPHQTDPFPKHEGALKCRFLLVQKINDTLSACLANQVQHNHPLSHGTFAPWTASRGFCFSGHLKESTSTFGETVVITYHGGGKCNQHLPTSMCLFWFHDLTLGNSEMLYPRDPGSPNLRMVSWNLNDLCVSEVMKDTLIIIWEYDWIPRVRQNLLSESWSQIS